MDMATQTAVETLVVRHHYKANPRSVFNAWSDANALSQWFGPPSHQCKVERYDFQENGGYQIRMIPIAEDTDCGGDSSEDSVCAGQFVQIVPNEKIVMTFTWIENGGDIGDTLLTIEFLAKDKGTELVLTHERLPNQPMVDAHKGGWEGTLQGLEDYLSAL